MDENFPKITWKNLCRNEKRKEFTIDPRTYENLYDKDDISFWQKKDRTKDSTIGYLEENKFRPFPQITLI